MSIIPDPSRRPASQHFAWCEPADCANDLDDDGRLWIHRGATVEFEFTDDSARYAPFVLELTHTADPDNGPFTNRTQIWAAGWLLSPEDARRLAGALTRLAALLEQS